MRGKICIKGLFSQFLNTAVCIGLVLLEQPEAPKTAGVHKAQFLVIVQTKNQMGMLFHRVADGRLQQGAGHAQVDNDAVAAGKAKDQELSTALDMVKGLACELPAKGVCFWMGHHLGAVHEDLTDAAAFEARLFALAAEAVEREAVDSASYLTREVMVDLSVLDISREKEDWTDKELERLARQAAFEAELEEFALDIMGEYLTGTVGGEIEDAAWSRENEEEETAEDTLGNGDSQEAAILPGGKEAQIS